MNVNLSRDLYDFVKAAVKSGRYTSASEVVRDALRTKREIALADLGRKIDEGLESARRGESFDGDEVMRELWAHSAKRRAERKANG
jgi:antitoxin ParD1/3/4